MPLVRKNPLPVGWYYVDYPAAKGRAFESWVHGTPGVAIRATEFDPDSTLTWVLFEVLQDAPWDAKTIGFWPDAGRPGMTQQDTVQRPEPEPGLTDRIEKAADQFASALKVVLIVGGVVGGVWLLKSALAMKGKN